MSNANIIIILRILIRLHCWNINYLYSQSHFFYFALIHLEYFGIWRYHIDTILRSWILFHLLYSNSIDCKISFILSEYWSKILKYRNDRNSVNFTIIINEMIMLCSIINYRWGCAEMDGIYQLERRPMGCSPCSRILVLSSSNAAWFIFCFIVRLFWTC